MKDPMKSKFCDFYMHLKCILSSITKYIQILVLQLANASIAARFTAGYLLKKGKTARQAILWGL